MTKVKLKLLRVKHRCKPSCSWLRLRWFLRYDTKSTKNKMDKMGFVKIKNVYSTKENIKKVKSPQNGRKYPEVRYLEFVSRIYNELL